MTHVAVTLTYVTRSDQAIGFEEPERFGMFWLPKSQIRNLDDIVGANYKNGDEVEVEIPT